MGFYQSEYWLSDTWGSNRQERRSGTYRPYVPDTLCDREILLTAETSDAISRAQTAITLLNTETKHLTSTEPLARLLLRAEAIASSKIEGLEMNARKLLEYEALDELGVSHRIDGTEAAVLANISAMQHGVEAAADTALTVESICAINRGLLAKTDMEQFGGVLRDHQNWIGGNNVNPLGAAYVPPKPEYVPALMQDLSDFINTSPLPPLAVAAIAHAQLETIHPFADGNGRTGRAIVHGILRKAQVVTRVIPPISLVLATDRSRYIANLAAYRTDDADPSRMSHDAINEWTEYFAWATLEACERAKGFEKSLADIEATWRERVRPRANSAADILLDRLLDNPVVSIESAARLTGRSYEAARNAVAALSDSGVLTQNARNRKSSLYVAQDVVSAFTRYERALATTSGNTADEKPGRPVPQRVNVQDSAKALAEAKKRQNR